MGLRRKAQGTSLKDSFLVGPDVQDDWFSLVIRSRKFAIASVADVDEMYREIVMHEDDRPLQINLWRFDSLHPSTSRV